MAVLLAVSCAARAQFTPEQLAARQVVRSLSGRFIINGPRVDFTQVTNRVRVAKRDQVYLDTPVVAISAERVKEAVYEELQIRDTSQNPIYVNLLPAGARTTVQAIRYLDGWHHRVELPERVDREEFVRAICAATLMEMGGRIRTGQALELPAWLSEGLTRHLNAKALTPLVMQTEAVPERVPEAVFNRSATGNRQLRYFDSQRMPDPYRQVRVAFQYRKPLELAALGQPGNLNNEADVELFRCCSQLFTAEILKLPNGPSNMLKFIRLLPDYMNWQLAFMQAFQGSFQSTLDLEKWWSVTLVSFQNRDQYMKLAPEDGLMQLSQILAVPVNIRSSGEAIPDSGVTTIQSLISNGSLDQQRRVLTRTVQQLRALEWNVPTDLLKLIDDYRFTIESYLAKRSKAVEASGRVTVGQTVPSLVRETVQKLNLLDQLHSDFASYGIKSASAASNLPRTQP